MPAFRDSKGPQADVPTEDKKTIGAEQVLKNSEARIRHDFVFWGRDENLYFQQTSHTDLGFVNHKHDKFRVHLFIKIGNHRRT